MDEDNNEQTLLDQEANGTQGHPLAPQEFRKRLIEAGVLSSRWLLRFQEPNGTDRRITFREVWERYQRDHLPTISESSRFLKNYRCERFLPPLFHLRMCELTPQVISEFVRFAKNKHEQRSPSRKYNFDKELKDLKSIFNWYQETVDFRFAVPLRPSHLKLGVIAELPRKDRRITLEQFHQFLDKLPVFYRDFALIQFFCGARVGEIAGLHWKNIDFVSRVLKIQEVMVWIDGVPKVKPCPKNGLAREVFMNDTMLEVLNRHEASTSVSCSLVFHREGQPLRYNAIGAAYNKAWRKAGLSFSGTHLMRYLAAQQGRLLAGSIDAAKAVTGHQSLQLAEKYSNYTSMDQNRNVVEKLEAAFQSKKAG